MKQCFKFVAILQSFAALLAVSLLFGCSDQTIHFGQLTLSSNANSVSEDFPADLIYPNAKVKVYGMLDTGGFWSPAQFAIFTESDDDSANIISHYLTLLQQQNWQILQSRYFETNKKTVLVGESLFKQTVTIVVADQKPTVVKLYLKRSSDD
ncbi:MAG: hypothetical protein H3C43_05575 [Leptonema sp. (in: Bacteria)]|nr:hypothetical protein [Leptonema sp. (in: bacteria)]